MPLLAALRENLAGAWMVMRGRPEGLDRLDLTLSGFWRSFAAIVLVLPIAMVASIAVLRAGAAVTDEPELASFDLWPETAVLIADWLIFPIVFALVARPIGLSARYVPLIVARNWAAVIVSAVVTLPHAAYLLGLLPEAPLAFFALLGIAVWFWFAFVVARTALVVPARTALPIVVLDLLLSLLVGMLFSRLE